MQHVPTQSEFNEWLLHPTTQFLRSWARSRRERLRDLWEAGNFSAAFTMEMAVKNAGATGACGVYREVEEIDYEILTMELDNGKSERFDPPGPSSPGGAL